MSDNGNIVLELNIADSPQYAPVFQILLKEHGVEIGHVYVYIIGDISRHKRPYALIDDLHVNETHRRKGYAEKLLFAAEQKAKERKCYKIVANTRLSNCPARGLYKKAGYREHGHEFRRDFN